MENVSNINSKWCETKIDQFQRCHSNLQSYYSLQSLRHWDNNEQNARCCRICSRPFHRIQHRLAHFHLNCSYADCITDWSVLANRSIVIRLQNSYKIKTFPYASLQKLRTSQAALQSYRSVFHRKLKQFHFIKFQSSFHEQTNLNISVLLFILFITDCMQIPGHGR